MGAETLRRRVLYSRWVSLIGLVSHPSQHECFLSRAATNHRPRDVGPSISSKLDDISPGTIMNSRRDIGATRGGVVEVRYEQTDGGGRVVEGSRRWRPLNPGREASSLI